MLHCSSLARLRARLPLLLAKKLAASYAAPLPPTPPQTDNLLQLAKLTGIRGARSITCPVNREACPGTNAVSVVARLGSSLAQFRKVEAQWRANLAAAAGVALDRVAIVDIEVLGSGGSGAGASHRRLLAAVQDTDAVVKTSAAPAKAASGRRGGGVASAKDVEDTAAVVQQEARPKPKIVVTTNIQPLTEGEQASVLGTVKGAYFQETFFAVRGWWWREG